jgi:hypothetical protein
MVGFNPIMPVFFEKRDARSEMREKLVNRQPSPRLKPEWADTTSAGGDNQGLEKEKNRPGGQEGRHTEEV